MPLAPVEMERALAILTASARARAHAASLRALAGFPPLRDPRPDWIPPSARPPRRRPIERLRGVVNRVFVADRMSTPRLGKIVDAAVAAAGAAAKRARVAAAARKAAARGQPQPWSVDLTYWVSLGGIVASTHVGEPAVAMPVSMSDGTAAAAVPLARGVLSRLRAVVLPAPPPGPVYDDDHPPPPLFDLLDCFDFPALWEWYSTDRAGARARRRMGAARAAFESSKFLASLTATVSGGLAMARTSRMRAARASAAAKARASFRESRPPVTECMTCRRGFALRRDRRSHERSGLCVGREYSTVTDAYLYGDGGSMVFRWHGASAERQESDDEYSEENDSDISKSDSDFDD